MAIEDSERQSTQRCGSFPNESKAISRRHRGDWQDFESLRPSRRRCGIRSTPSSKYPNRPRVPIPGRVHGPHPFRANQAILPAPQATDYRRGISSGAIHLFRCVKQGGMNVIEFQKRIVAQKLFVGCARCEKFKQVHDSETRAADAGLSATLSGFNSNAREQIHVKDCMLKAGRCPQDAARRDSGIQPEGKLEHTHELRRAFIRDWRRRRLANG